MVPPYIYMNILGTIQSGMGADCDENNWKYFARGTPKKILNQKDPFGAFQCILINYINGPWSPKNGNQLKNWKLSCLFN